MLNKKNYYVVCATKSDLAFMAHGKFIFHGRQVFFKNFVLKKTLMHKDRIKIFIIFLYIGNAMQTYKIYFINKLNDGHKNCKSMDVMHLTHYLKNGEKQLYELSSRENTAL